MIRIISVGKKHEPWITTGLERYQKRLQKPWNVEWILLPHSALEGSRARQEESERILSRLGTDDFVVLLDETGTLLGSPALSHLCEEVFISSRPLVFVIGGAYGVDERLQMRADQAASLSRLVFPHQLVRLILIEQLYRAQSIANGGRYHHE